MEAPLYALVMHAAGHDTKRQGACEISLLRLIGGLTFQDKLPVIRVVHASQPDPDVVPKVSDRPWYKHKFDVAQHIIKERLCCRLW